MHSFAIRVRAEKQKQKEVKPSSAALAAAKKKLQNQQGGNKAKANGVKKPASKKPVCPPNKQAKKKKTALPEITYHVATTRPAWADEPGERYGAYHRFLQEQKQKDIKEKEKNKSKAMKETRSKALSAHRRWLKKNNKVQDVAQDTPKVSNGKEKENPPKKERSGAANIVLYVGLGLIVIGLIMTFVGLGENGFRTIELQLVGPSLIGMGIFFCLLRILSCTFADFFARKCPCCCKQPDSTKNASQSKTQSTNVSPKKEEAQDDANGLAQTHSPTSSPKSPTVQPSNDVITFVNEASTIATFENAQASDRPNGSDSSSKQKPSELDDWYNEFEEADKTNRTRSKSRKNELMLNPNKLLG